VTARQTLWDFLESTSSSSRLVDSADDGLDDDYFERPPGARGHRWKVALGAGLGLVALIVVVAVGSHIFRSATPIPSVVVASQAEAVKQAEDLSVPTELTVVVHVVGAVESPGVIELPENSRIIDALAKAGGAREDAILSGINLARVLFDGEQIVVPSQADEPAAVSIDAPPGLVSLSRGTSAELETLPRVGPATAARIIAWREENGPFTSVDDVLAVSGIGPATLEGFRALVVP
jgi:competence protein ComEA